MAKASRVAVTQHTMMRSTRKMGRLLIELSDPRSEQCLKRSLYLMSIVDTSTRMNWARYTRSKYQAGDVLRDFIAAVVKVKHLTTGAVPTDEGDEFEGDFQPLLMQHFIRHELSPPYTPQKTGLLRGHCGVTTRGSHGVL